MKKNIAKKWVRALRSKKYRQAKGALKIESKNGNVSHCCLGVLCELYQQEQIKIKKKPLPVAVFSNREAGIGFLPQPRLWQFDDNLQTLPARVQRWAGLHEESGQFRGDFSLNRRNYTFHSLAQMNDAGCGFSTIADVIETYVNKI